MAHRYSVPRWHRPTKRQLEVLTLIERNPCLLVCEMAVAMGTAGYQISQFAMARQLARMERRRWLTHILGHKRTYRVTDLGRAILLVGLDAGWAR